MCSRFVKKDFFSLKVFYNTSNIHFFPETLRLQGPRLHQALHRSLVFTQAREDSARSGVLREQEAQGGQQGGGVGRGVCGGGGRQPALGRHRRGVAIERQRQIGI